MRLSTFIAWLLGVALLAGLVARNHPVGVLDAVAALKGWLLLVILFHAVPLYFDVVAWQRLFAAPPPLPALFGIRWVAEGVNGLLPVPHLGELLRAQLARRLTLGGEAAASVVVDVTLGVATQVLFAVLGLALLSAVPGASTLQQALLFATALLTLCAAIFYFLQHAGMFALATAVARRWPGPARGSFDITDAHALDSRVRALYARRAQLFLSGVWRLTGWVAGAGEVWLVLYSLGHPVSFMDAIILESLSQAARTAAFAIPGGLGVQDGALLVLCAQLGLGAEIGLALSLAKRCRELVLGLPGLAIGYVIQARRLASASAWPGEPPSA